MLWNIKNTKEVPQSQQRTRRYVFPVKQQHHPTGRKVSHMYFMNKNSAEKTVLALFFPMAEASSQIPCWLTRKPWTFCDPVKLMWVLRMKNLVSFYMYLLTSLVSKYRGSGFVIRSLHNLVKVQVTLCAFSQWIGVHQNFAITLFKVKCHILPFVIQMEIVFFVLFFFNIF